MIFAWASLKILAAPQPQVLPAEAFQSSCCRTSVKGSVSYWGPDSGDEWHQAAAPLAFQWPVVSTACTCSLDKAGNFLMSFGCCSLIGTNKSNLGLLVMFVRSVVGHMQIALGGTACLSTPSRVQFGCCEFIVSYLSSKKNCGKYNQNQWVQPRCPAGVGIMAAERPESPDYHEEVQKFARMYSIDQWLQPRR